MLMNFDKYEYLCRHYHNKNRDHFYRSQKSAVHIGSKLFYHLHWATTDFTVN